jgi:hypothetical protein
LRASRCERHFFAISKAQVAPWLFLAIKDCFVLLSAVSALAVAVLVIVLLLVVRLVL